MGHHRHHAIVVTSPFERDLTDAHEQATALFPVEVSPIVEAALNGYASFMVSPDGSKEGWPESDQCDKARAALIRYLRSQDYEDGSNPLDWVEVEFGGEGGQASVIRCVKTPEKP